MGRARTAQKSPQRLASSVAAIDSGLLPASRFLPANSAWDEVFVELVVASALSSLKVAPVFVRNNVPIDGTEAQLIDLSQEVTLGAAGGNSGFLITFYAKPGYRCGIRVTALAGGAVTAINAGYASSQ